MFHPLDWLGHRLARFLAKPRAVETHFSTSAFNLLMASLKKGDVLLVEGSSRFSTAIKYLSQSSWSHAALYVGDALMASHPRLGPHVLIEADVTDGVRAVALHSYQGAHTRICRPVGLSGPEVDAVIAHAAHRLGQRYDVRNIIDLMRYLMPTPPVPGRWRRRMLALGGGEPTQAICSSLIAAAFQSVRYPILPFVDRSYRAQRGARQARREILRIRDSRLYTPRDFDISPYFRIVKPLLENGFNLHQIRWAEPALDDSHEERSPDHGAAALPSASAETAPDN
ncbi:YiiX/YebB-like N1pC/P60 family cysteine hydrolase [Dyella sp.]|uniref:YiiX/YebB-like N1pC/P60 family cysteine hydrolase n=1 Tax=Dyella sp. TaxID=1869338 RepID=UPI002D77A9A4|nr:YiiX/YebB-like N1pC/P60 family cysteine hydrolase [Dyella sp.]HET6433803.1 YiiX/YebB-like N1pC/P60 family cysteine hydrolase [Dyella sp.]